MSRIPPAAPRALAWPLPALLTWLAAWVLEHTLAAAGVAAALAQAVAAAAAAAIALHPACGSGWRRLLIASGYPLALAAAGAVSWPAWVWIAALATLALAYPVRAWRDAPWFPTPAGALCGLSALVSLPAGSRVLDAGCGLGDGLAELRREWPQAGFDGIEWSLPLSLAAAARCRFARVRRGDMWAAEWTPYALIYLFQRPESMARALAKAEREMAPGAWLASLEFGSPQRAPDAVLRRPGTRPVLLYRIGAAQPPSAAADNSARTVACRRVR